MREKILATIRNAESIPTPPVFALRLMELVLDDAVSLKDLSKEIIHDVSLSSKILRIVNSAYYGLQNPVNNIQQAVVILGEKIIKNLVLGISIIDSFSSEKERRLYKKLIEASLCSAVASRMISHRVFPKFKEEAFVAGLLENIGMLVLLYCFPEEYNAVYKEASERRLDIGLIERELLGVTHSEAGKMVADSWSLPQIISLPIQYHHQPRQIPEKALSDEYVNLIRFAYLGGLVADIFYGWNKSAKISLFKKDIYTFYKLNESVVEDIFNGITTQMESIAAGFDIQVQSKGDYQKILNSANVELGKLNLQYEQLYRESKKLVMELEQKNRQLDLLTKEILEKNKKLHEMADRDGLTNLYNHRYFMDYLEHQIQQWRRSKTPLSMIMMDIDHFKKINDTYGHQSGDIILKELSAILLNSIRRSDMAARYGGEEFTIILNVTNLAGAAIFAEKLRLRIAEKTFTTMDGKKINVTVSLGVATIMPAIDSAEKLIEAADRLLYYSKKAGRNRVSVLKV